MNRKLFTNVLLFISILATVGLACNLTSIANTVGGSANSVSSLWSDVPKMSGMTQTSQALPVTAKLLIQSYISAASKGQGSLDFIGFTTNQTPADVANYYTIDRMTAAGWSTSDQIGCSTFDTGTATPGSNSSSAICIFARDEGNNKGALLAIFATPNSDNASQTDIYFARVELSNLTPQATQ